MKGYLAVFMKSPGTRAVKTRLQSAFSEESTHRLYGAFVEDTLEKISDFPCDVKVICTLGKPPPRNLFVPRHGEAAYWLQEGVDLGERLRHYFDRSFKEGAGKSVVIGSDSPTLPVSYLKEAFSLLDRKELVIGPSLDGGYYLIGMTSPHPELFNNISWGTGDVLERTIVQNPHLEGKWAFLDSWYDVDTAEDLLFLKTHLDRMKKAGEDLPQRTSRILSKLKV